MIDYTIVTRNGPWLKKFLVTMIIEMLLSILRLYQIRPRKTAAKDIEPQRMKT